MATLGARAPHGPDMDGHHDPIHEMNLDEKQNFDFHIRPDDSYTPEGVYWADLPMAQRVRFVASTDAQEAKSELAAIGTMMKEDPLSPVGYYFRNMVLPGAGLGLEG